MTVSVQVTLKRQADPDLVCEECKTIGYTHLYTLQDPEGVSELYGEIPCELLQKLSCIPSVAAVIQLDDAKVDWTAQWEAFGLNYHDGLLHIDLHACGYLDYPVAMQLEPGPGFGDLSHPTTHLVLAMMAPHVHKKVVCDIGCGSGVLSIAAAVMGASRVDAIDIDPLALQHTSKNASLNHLDRLINSFTPEQYQESTSVPDTILLNMIPHEQSIAWQSMPRLHSLSCTWIVSGILQEKRADYLEECLRRGWKLQEEQSREGWLGLKFISS